MSDDYMKIDCCLATDTKLGRTFHFTVELDPCNLKLKFSIENFFEEIDMSLKQGSQQATITLMDIVTLR